MKRLIISLTLIGLLFVSLVQVLAHASLVRSDPPAGATLDRAPAEVFIWFSEQLGRGSKLTVFDGQFQSVDKGETFIDASDTTLMRIQLGQLGPGRYTVNWKASAIDGHVSSGSYDFFVRDAGLPPLLIAGVAAAILILLGAAIVLNRSRNRNS